MRTTLDIDEDILAAARERARRERKSMGALLSELARRGMSLPEGSYSVQESEGPYGLRPFPSREGIVTNELINKLREDDAY